MQVGDFVKVVPHADVTDWPYSRKERIGSVGMVVPTIYNNPGIARVRFFDEKDSSDFCTWEKRDLEKVSAEDLSQCGVFAEGCELVTGESFKIPGVCDYVPSGFVGTVVKVFYDKQVLLVRFSILKENFYIEISFDSKFYFKQNSLKKIFFPGSCVRVLRKECSGAHGWNNFWNEAMDAYIGKIAIVLDYPDSFGVCLALCNTTETYCFPESVLSPVDGFAAMKEVGIKPGYLAQIRKEAGEIHAPLKDFDKSTPYIVKDVYPGKGEVCVQNIEMSNMFLTVPWQCLIYGENIFDDEVNNLYKYYMARKQAFACKGYSYNS